MKHAILGSLLLFILFSTADAAGLGRVVTKIGDWSIYLTQDAMTDAPSCVATYKDRTDIQLSDESFAISFRGRGGVSSFKYRLDDQPPSGVVLPTKVEKEIGAVYLGGQAFSQLAAAKRIRVQVLTVLSSLVDEDIDLSSFQSVEGYLTSTTCKKNS